MKFTIEVGLNVNSLKPVVFMMDDTNGFRQGFEALRPPA